MGNSTAAATMDVPVHRMKCDAQSTAFQVVCPAPNPSQHRMILANTKMCLMKSPVAAVPQRGNLVVMSSGNRGYRSNDKLTHHKIKSPPQPEISRAKEISLEQKASKISKVLESQYGHGFSYQPSKSMEVTSMESAAN